MTETWRFQKRTRKHSEKNFYVPYVVKNSFDSVLLRINIRYYNLFCSDKCNATIFHQLEKHKKVDLNDFCQMEKHKKVDLNVFRQMEKHKKVELNDFRQVEKYNLLQENDFRQMEKSLLSETLKIENA